MTYGHSYRVCDVYLSLIFFYKVTNALNPTIYGYSSRLISDWRIHQFYSVSFGYLLIRRSGNMTSNSHSMENFSYLKYRKSDCSFFPRVTKGHFWRSVTSTSYISDLDFTTLRFWFIGLGRSNHHHYRSILRGILYFRISSLKAL